jgi:serine-type D-Ala-D-Ala carboxypeptidase (penicillin-binding protein 5/6)
MASGILVDMDTGTVLWSRDERAVRAPASLTKIITALVAIEHLNPDDQVTITPEARNAPGSRIYAEQGWTFKARDLLWGLLLQSGNDAAIALAQKASPDGTVAGFMKLENDKLKRIGATDTAFKNPHGYDQPGHVTSARDLALMTMAAMRNPLFKEIVSSRTHAIPWGDGTQHLLINHNKLLSRYPGTIGVKTGYTGDAGNCLASAVSRDGHTLIAIVLGSPSHYVESMALYNWGFANLAALRAASTEVIQPKAVADSVALNTRTLQNAPSAAGERIGGSLVSSGPAGPPPLLPFLALTVATSLLAMVGVRRVLVNPR